jgi:hypothetical protein
LPELEIVVGIQRQTLLFLVELDARVGTFEIEAIGDLLVRLIERVVDFNLIHFGDDVERWHASSRGKSSGGFQPRRNFTEYDMTGAPVLSSNSAAPSIASRAMSSAERARSE